MFVEKADLGIANSRMQAGFLTANQLVGPPVGAFLFGAGMVFPFVAQLVCVVLGVVLVARIGSTRDQVRESVDTHVRQDIAEGIRWLWRHAAIRTLAIVILTFNITWGAAWSILVLWSLDRVHMGEVGFGLLTTAAALGGILGTACYGRLERRFDLATLMKTCLLLEVLMHLALALTTVPWLALLIMFGLSIVAGLILSVVIGSQLGDEILASIVRLQLGRIARRVAEHHKIPFDYDDEAVRLIVSRCTEVESGGRMIDAILTNTVLPAISREFLVRTMAGSSLNGVRLAVAAGDFEYQFT